MGNCFSGGPKLAALLETELAPIFKIFGEDASVMLLQPDGQVLVGLSKNGNHNEITQDLISTMLTFKKTASTFGVTLQLDSKIIHIRGKSTLFSSYDIDKYSLNIFSHHSSTASHEDTCSYDKSTEAVITGVRVVLRAHSLTDE